MSMNMNFLMDLIFTEYLLQSFWTTTFQEYNASPYLRYVIYDLKNDLTTIPSDFVLSSYLFFLNGVHLFCFCEHVLFTLFQDKTNNVHFEKKKKRIGQSLLGRQKFQQCHSDTVCQVLPKKGMDLLVARTY